MDIPRVLIMGAICVGLMLIGFIITIIDFKLMHDHPEDYCDDD